MAVQSRAPETNGHAANYFAPAQSLTRMCSTYNISDNVLLEVFRWLPPLGLLRCQQVSTRFYTMARHNTLWQRALLRAAFRGKAKNAMPTYMDGITQRHFQTFVTIKFRTMEMKLRKRQTRSTCLLAGWTATIAAAPATLASIASLSHRFNILCGILR